MSKRAEQATEKAYGHFTAENIDEVFKAQYFFQEGYEQAEKDLIALVKQYLEKGERCMGQEGESQIYAFWNGFHNCAENILRELEEE